MFTYKLHLFLKTINKVIKLALLASLIPVLSLSIQNAHAVEPTDISKQQNPELQLHSSLVLKALQVDFYNERCRGISVAKNFNKVNRLYITKYSITANNFIKEFINPDVRSEKAAQEIHFKKNLNSLGGCTKAKQQDWIQEIHDQFKDLYQQAEQSAWYPEEN